MNKPCIFLGSSGKQEKLIQGLTRGLEEVAVVKPWTTSFNPGTTTLERLLELIHEVDFAAFVFARDDWTMPRDPVRPLREITWSFKPAFSGAYWECAELSSCMRTARSFQAIFLVLRVCDTATRRPLLK